MNKPKLREDFFIIIDNEASDWAHGGSIEEKHAFIEGVYWSLSNLHKLLEPREQPLVNGKRVAIVEVE